MVPTGFPLPSETDADSPVQKMHPLYESTEWDTQVRDPLSAPACAINTDWEEDLHQRRSLPHTIGLNSAQANTGPQPFPS